MLPPIPMLKLAYMEKTSIIGQMRQCDLSLVPLQICGRFKCLHQNILQERQRESRPALTSWSCGGNSPHNDTFSSDLGAGDTSLIRGITTYKKKLSEFRPTTEVMLASPQIHTCGSKIPRLNSDHSKASTSVVASGVSSSSFDPKTSICFSIYPDFSSRSETSSTTSSWTLSLFTMERLKRIFIAVNEGNVGGSLK